MICAYEDLHIDEVHPAYGKRENWLEESSTCFHLAVATRDERNADFTVALGFSINAGKRPKGINFTDLPGLISQFDQSPRSLNLFQNLVEKSRGLSRDLDFLDVLKQLKIYKY